jgi:hypothetical protein
MNSIFLETCRMNNPKLLNSIRKTPPYKKTSSPAKTFSKIAESLVFLFKNTSTRIKLKPSPLKSPPKVSLKKYKQLSLKSNHTPPHPTSRKSHPIKTMELLH